MTRISKTNGSNQVLFPKPVFWLGHFLSFTSSNDAPWARTTNNVKKPQSQMCESCRKALRFLKNKTETFLVYVTYLTLRFSIVQSFNKQTKQN